ncbi:pentatricopeptide repeat-containing At5g52630 [Olea europaea subsp. europaea]|uniref:Pentatricopeptide repeat-containing At5g52630 n=2 Tax=Olea europaea subsp. europaea TaxID=158383 RepID=A0A8S0PWS4_OLEEU|nr:pentatricopeptide repeat-containing At5g52630 [Olea europaea subsp. europaea]
MNSLETNIDPRCAHAKAIKTCRSPTPQNISFFNNLITLYSKSNLHSSALQLFHSIPCPNTVTWASVISAFSHSSTAFHLFLSMLRHPTRSFPNARTLATLFRTCSLLPDYIFGFQLHAIVVKFSLQENPFTSSGLVSLYCKTGDMNSAEKAFDEMCERDGVCFAAMINGLAQNKRPIDALRYFTEMRREDILSNPYSVSGALCAGSGMTMFEQCRIIHGHAMVTGLDLDVIVGTALIDGYGKCGVLEDARKVFNELGMELNLVGFNAMMAGYAQHGDKEYVIELLSLMESRGMKPDEYSFLAILTAFYNAGMTIETERWFNKMEMEYKLKPRIEHYTCLAGALGRAGRLEAAEKIALTIPYEPDAAIWRVLLSSCMNHENASIAWRMSERLQAIDPNDDSAYVILANVLASAGSWDEVKEVWKIMKDRKVKKEVGRSWIEVQGAVHVFFSGDRRHVRNNEIYAKLAELMEEIEKLGYVPIWEEMFHELEKNEKRKMLSYHSEKLAVAFGLLSGVTPPGKALRIIKNLRICKDCHEAFKYISRVVEREIIVRDVRRYHRFLNGTCSCDDYW